ncbi:4-alpha-glucanotransferase [Rubrivivax sp. A210]|uniref:4-alpha-glucanotransferase n=1 Tax=Rubrivivax sp. A210 TaxID=2772301 RepID=UPI0019190C32|nr:4-alpha-glucanotransferase [Rubrivivax sp. A210]CAD5366438.1 4-alpha-glucanotransferase [Rubrivivax sp. A210]
MRFPRASGVLLHPTSLPGPHGSGDFGREAYHFVDWLANAGQRLWQVLPLAGIGPGNSPYMSNSAFAGNVLLVDLAELQQQGWLEAVDLVPVAGLDDDKVNFAAMHPFRMERLARAAVRFAAAGTPAQREDYARFLDEHRSWIADFALFMSLCEAQGWRDWCEWEPALAARQPAAMEAARQAHAGRIAFWQFCQWRFYRQWAALKAYANGKGIKIIGDTPIFIAYLSAEVWANQALFDLDATGRPTVVAGVPPDFFSATGQRWGNPLYRWSEHAKHGYAWWVERVRRAFELFDIVRIDHFRGFAGYWEIPASAPTAQTGRWVPGPGAALFEAIAQALGPVPVIAEDLGIITPDVDALRKQFGFPGMRILQFAFAGDAADRFLPHNHEPDTVVYPGTHDNDTVAGWWAAASDHERHFARGYLATDGHDMPWTLIRAAMASVADTAVHPMQDVLALPTEHRMNFPGQESGWWGWRFQWGHVQAWHAARLAELARLYGRTGASP